MSNRSGFGSTFVFRLIVLSKKNEEEKKKRKNLALLSLTLVFAIVLITSLFRDVGQENRTKRHFCIDNDGNVVQCTHKHGPSSLTIERMPLPSVK